MVRKTYTAASVMASGPYSHAVDAGDYVYFSGQTAKNAIESEAGTSDIATQTQQCFANLAAVLAEANLTFDDVVKANVYLTSMKHFDAMNDVYKSQFNAPYPARTCVAVLELPLQADVEIEIVAKRPIR